MGAFQLWYGRFFSGMLHCWLGNHLYLVIGVLVGDLQKLVLFPLAELDELRREVADLAGDSLMPE